MATVSAQEIYQGLSTSLSWIERALVVLADRDLLTGVQAQRLQDMAEKVRRGDHLEYGEMMDARSELRRWTNVTKLVGIALEKGKREQAAVVVPKPVPAMPRELAEELAEVDVWTNVEALEQMWDFCSSFGRGSEEFSIAAWTQSYLKSRRRLPPPDLRGKLIRVAKAAGWKWGIRHWSEVPL